METENIPTYELIHRLKQYKHEIENSRYDLILNFINDVCGLKLKSLMEINKYNYDNICKTRFKNVLDEYKDKFKDELNIDIDEKRISIIKIISNCLKSIDYILLSKKVLNETTNKTDILLSINFKNKKTKINKYYN